MVEPSPRERLELCRREWPLGLVPPQAFERACGAAARAPRSITGFFAECHLCDPTRTDLIARVHRWDRAAILAAGSVPQRLTQFFDWWRTVGDPAGIVVAVDVEWDLIEEPSEFFLCPLFEPDLCRGHFAIEHRRIERSSRGLPSLTEELGPYQLQALDPEVSPRSLEQLLRCVRELPPLGVLLPGWPSGTRPSSADRSIRVIVSLPQFAARSYLERLRWPGDLEAFERAADLLCAGQCWLGFDLDISEDGIGPRIGLYREVLWARARDAELMAILSGLAELGLCLPARLSGLCSWLKARDALETKAERRSLSLKFIVDGTRAPVVKAYVSSFDELGAFTRANTQPQN